LYRLLITISLLAACGEQRGAPPCEAVGTKFVVLAKFDLDKETLDDDTRRLIRDQIPAMRDSLVNACKDGKWEPAVRTCMAESIDHHSFESCERALTPTQRNALERGGSDER
jgi:hypothetical protein